MRRLVLLAALLTPTLALATEPTAAAKPAPAVVPRGIDDLKLEQPWVRLPPGDGKVTGAFVKITNRSATPHAIVRASSPAASVVELHTHVKEGDLFKMRPVDRFELPPNATTELKPGSLHFMLMGLKEPLTADSKVTISFTLEDGSAATMQVPVRPFDGAAKH